MLAKFLGILAGAAPKGNFHAIDPIFQPVTFIFRRLRFRPSLYNFRNIKSRRHQLHAVLGETLALFADQRVAQRDFGVEELQTNGSRVGAQLERRATAIQLSRGM